MSLIATPGDQPGHGVADPVGVFLMEISGRVAEPDLDVVFLVRGGPGPRGADVDAGDLLAVELAVLPARLPGLTQIGRASCRERV